MDWGLLAAAGVLTIVPGALVIWFVRNYIAKGFAHEPDHEGAGYDGQDAGRRQQAPIHAGGRDRAGHGGGWFVRNYIAKGFALGRV
jgi:hypothetical protein